jgi:polysaccharide pyruvyl transferase WcaK-like protein
MSSSPLRVHHYFPLGSGNVGDHMVAHAIQSQLPEYFGPCEFTSIPVNDRYSATDRPIGLRGDNLDHTNAHADLVIIGGSNLLEPRKPRRTGDSGTRLGRWGVFTDLDSIRRLRVPVLLLGMGTGSSFGQSIRPYVEPSVSEIKALFDKSFAHAVRDVTTVEQLARIGVSTRCTGCPVTFLSDRPVEAQTSGPLAVSLPPYYIRDSLQGRWFMHQTLRYIRWLIGREIPVLVTLHEDRDVAFAKSHLPPPAPPLFDIYYTESLPDQLARFESIRGMVGFRLHAALTAWALGKPILPVGLDWRGKGFIRTIGSDAYSLWPGRWGQFSALRKNTLRLLAADSDLLAHQQQARAALHRSYHAFLSEAGERFRSIHQRATVR